MKALAAGIAVALSIGTALAVMPQWGIVSARLVEPTDRYGHDVLGGNEYAAMEVGYLWASDVVFPARISLPEDRVFEDVEARLTNLGGPQKGEDATGPRMAQHIVVVESSRAGGAELAVYGLAANRIDRIAATPPIGRRNRWLAVAGIADFDGDGQNDIAYVETPHIGGTLRLWSLTEDGLVEKAAIGGVSNHRIGENFISGGVRNCGDGPELVLADSGQTRLLRARIVKGAWQLEPIAHSVRPELWTQALACER